jgi:hypothetical protein
VSCDAGLLAGQHLLSAVVTAVGDHLDGARTGRLPCRTRHGAELRAVAAGHHYVARDHEVVPGFNRCLEV